VRCRLTLGVTGIELLVGGIEIIEIESRNEKGLVVSVELDEVKHLRLAVAPPEQAPDENEPVAASGDRRLDDLADVQCPIYQSEANEAQTRFRRSELGSEGGLAPYVHAVVAKLTLRRELRPHA
jgi:hypothetical protein